MSRSAKGKVKRIYPDETGCYIRLDYSGTQPKGRYFRLDLSHDNYESLYTLALTAATNGYDLLIRTRKPISSSKYGRIVYMVVDW